MPSGGSTRSQITESTAATLSQQRLERRGARMADVRARDASSPNHNDMQIQCGQCVRGRVYN